VIEPFIVYAPNRISQDERLTYLQGYRERLLNLGTAPTIGLPINAE
jgi:NAD(P)H dehydrogenase (quinone)